MTSLTYDLIVVGARVAGSSAALLAARAGMKVLLVDRAAFPSDTLSTNYIHQPGCARLARWGVLDRVIASGAPPIAQTRFQADDIVIKGGISPDYPQREAYAPRRFVLDPILLEAAREAGAHVRQNCTALQLIERDGRCRGIVLRDRDGNVCEEHARLVVGADGMRSTVARLAGAGITVEHPTLTCAYYSFWEGMAPDYELYEGNDRWVGAVPTNDAVLVATYFPQDEFAHVRANAMAAHLAAVDTCAPALAERMRQCRQTGKLWGTGEQRNFFRRASGPGWALIGDAGHHKDSISARGITDALIQAELLVTKIRAQIDSDDGLDGALAEFAGDRDTLMMPGYQATLAVATPSSRPGRMDLLRHVARLPQAAPLYFDVVAGIRSGADLPSLLMRELARAA